jgi:HK97 family phage major capsid protein
MFTVKELREARGLIGDKYDALKATVEARDGKYTEDEFRQLNEFVSDIESFDAKIAAAEKREAFEARRAAEKLAANANPKTSDKEEDQIKRNFNLLGYLHEARTGTLTGINKELHEEAVKEARNLGTEVTGMGIPSLVLQKEKRDMNVGTTTAGGHAVAQDHKGIIDYLEDALVVKSLGADYMTGLVGSVKFSPEDSSAVAGWNTENGTAAELSPTLGSITMTPKRLTTFVDLSNQLMLQTSPNIEARVRRRLGGALARGMDKAAIQGTGSSNQPTGITATSGIGAVAMGTNGLALTWAKVVELFREVDVDNATIGQLAYLTNPLVRAAMQTIERSSGGNAFILDKANDPLNGYKLGVSNHVPSTLTKGSSSGVCSAMIFGNFNDLVIGQWGGLDIMANPYTKGKEGITEIIASAYADVAVLNPKSFAAILDILTA